MSRGMAKLIATAEKRTRALVSSLRASQYADTESLHARGKPATNKAGGVPARAVPGRARGRFYFGVIAVRLMIEPSGWTMAP